MGGTICLWYLYPYIYWYFLISSYYLTVSNGCSLTAMKTRSCHFLVKQFQMGGGDHLPLVSTCFLCSGISLYLPIIWLFQMGAHWLHWKVVEVTQSSGSFRWGVHLPLVSTCFLYVLVFPYIFLLFDCFGWALIDCIEKHRGHTELWQFHLGGTVCLWYLYPYIYWYFLIFSNKLTAFGIYMFSLHWYFLISSYCLTVSNGHSLTALKSIEVTQSSDSFIRGGPSAFGVYMFSLCAGISWYLPIIWLFRMGAHWLHWKALRSLRALTVSYGGVHLALVSTCFLYVLVISLYLPIIWLFRMGTHWLHWKA